MFVIVCMCPCFAFLFFTTTLYGQLPNSQLLRVFPLGGKPGSTVEVNLSGTDLDDDAALKVLSRMAKQRRESISEYEKAAREDLAAKERAELAVVEEFLPAALGEDELAVLVDEVIAQVGAAGPQDMGKVMGPLMKKVAGRADGNAVRSVVQGRLQG